MAQRPLLVVSPFGKSGSIMLLNPTDRNFVKNYGANAKANIKNIVTRRGTPPTYTP